MSSAEDSVEIKRAVASESQKFTLTFKDFEDFMQIYDGENSISIERWIKEFE